jgi:hypothetical protein
MHLCEAHHTKKSSATFLPVFEKSAKNSAAVSSGG